MKIKGLIFDFDGLILDTETPDHTAWVRIYKQYGQELNFVSYSKAIGAVYEFTQPAEILVNLVPGLDKNEIINNWVILEKQLLDAQTLLPGVGNILKEAKELNMKVAIASSATSDWVISHLEKFGIREYFSSINTVDLTGIPKPDPALYNLALKSMHLQPDNVIAFEDSPNGIKAAKAAGIYCIAIPNQTTIRLNLNEADLVVNSLEEIGLSELIRSL